MNRRFYSATEEGWDAIFATLAMDVESAHLEKGIRKELSSAMESLREIESDNWIKDIHLIVNHYYVAAKKDLDKRGMVEDDQGRMVPNKDHVFHALERLRKFTI